MTLMVRTTAKLVIPAVVALLALAGSTAVSSARASTHCPSMRGEVIASNALVEVSREPVTVLLGLQEAPGYVYRACARREGAYTEQVLGGEGIAGSATVKLAGGYVAVHGRFAPEGLDVLRLFAPAWDGRDVEVSPCPATATCTGTLTGIRGFALDRLGRLAWVESFGSGGTRWARLWTRTQAGKTHSVERHRGARSITGVRISGDRVRWSANGRARRTSIAHPRCQLDGDRNSYQRRHVYAANRDLLVASLPSPGDAEVVTTVSGCLRSDGRWRRLLTEYPAFSHGMVRANALAAGTWVALNWDDADQGNGAFSVIDLRSGRRLPGQDSWWPPVVDALAANGTYLFHSTPDSPGRLTSVRLYAARPGQPEVQLDEGAPPDLRDPIHVPVFTDVQIHGRQASWKNNGVAKTARLP